MNDINKINVLFVAGNWDDEGGRNSKYMMKFINSLNNKLGQNIQSFNGGNYDELEEILNSNAKNADVIFWFPNIPANKPKPINPKDINHKALLVNYKRNDNKYDFQELISIALSLRSDLTCEVRKDENGRYEMRIFDILGTLWSDYNTNITKSVAELVSRLQALKMIKYSRLICAGRSIPIKNTNIDEILSIYNDFGPKLINLCKPKEGVKRHLGNLSFRGFIDPVNRSNDIIFANERNALATNNKEGNFVAVKILNGKVNYYGDTKPSVDAGVHVKLFSKLPEVDYIFHSHTYLPDAKFTERAIPSGGLQEVDEIMKVINFNEYTKDFCVNLIGHGSVIFANSLEYIKEKFNQLERRDIPESLGTDFDQIEVDDGIRSFIHTLKGRALNDKELLEIRFNDGSIGTHNVKIKYYVETEVIANEDGSEERTNIVHKEAHIDLVIKGTPTELSIVGLYARRI